MKKILNLTWIEIAAICGFKSAVSARNSYFNRSKIFKFGEVVAKHYNSKIINVYTELEKKGTDTNTLNNLREGFGIIKCWNHECERTITEDELLLNADQCPHCGWEHDRDILDCTD